MTDTLPSTLCIAPFAQITTHPSGSFSPCPYLGGTSWSHDGTILEKWRGSELENLRHEFLAGKKPEICFRCWNEENIGKRSLRRRLFDMETETSDYQLFSDPQAIRDLMQSITDGSYKKGPKIISIKNGNVCNLKCRSCHPDDSSGWIQDAKKLYDAVGKKYYKIGLRESNWNDAQIDQLRELASNLSRLELFGGEPLYNKKVLKLLNHLVEDGSSRNISLYVNTNGSVDITAKIPNIDRFKDIDIGVSIDAIAEHFTYVRHPLTLDQVKENVRSWHRYFRSKNVQSNIQSITTVSILNIYYLAELKSTIKSIMGQTPFWNLLIHPRHLSIVNLPQEVKNVVVEKLRGDPEFDEFINFMMNNAADQYQWRTFFTIRDALDDIRGEKFDDVFPEFASVIKPYRLGSEGIKIFIGDMAQSWPAQYLTRVALDHDPHSGMLVQGKGHELVIIDPDGITRFVPRDELPSGTYHTGITKWSDLDALHWLLTHAKEVYYAPPEYWSDGPEIFTTLLPPRGWSKIVTEEILAKIPNVRRLEP